MLDKLLDGLFNPKAESCNRNLALGLVLVVALVLIGIVAFGFGGHLTATNRRIGGVAWGAMSLGAPRSSEGVNIKEPNVLEGMQAKAVGVWDTPGQRGASAGTGATIMGYSERETYGHKLPSL